VQLTPGLPEWGGKFGKREEGRKVHLHQLASEARGSRGLAFRAVDEGRRGQIQRSSLRRKESAQKTSSGRVLCPTRKRSLSKGDRTSPGRGGTAGKTGPLSRTYYCPGRRSGKGKITPWVANSLEGE